MPAAVANHPNRSSSNIKAGANPTPAMIKRAREEAGLTLEQAGELVYTSWRTFQNWEADRDSAENRRMHPATWEHFQAKASAIRLLKKREITITDLRRLGLHLPAWALELAEAS